MKTFDQIREEAQAVMEISKGMKQRYVKKAIGGDDDDGEAPSMTNLRYGTHLPGKHRNWHNTPNPRSNKDTNKEMEKRKKGIERATGSKKVAKAAAKGAGRAAKYYGRSSYSDTTMSQMDRDHAKGSKHLKKTIDKAVKAVK